MTTPALHYHTSTATNLIARPVFVGFSTPRSWNPVSALIRKMMKANLSHTWLLVEDPLFELRLVLEAHSTGFRLISFAEFVKENKVVKLLQPAHSLAGGLPEAGGWLGDQYDVPGLFGIFLVQVARWFRHKMENPFTSPRALFCSEAVVRVMKAAHYPGAEKLGDETSTPAELLAFLEAEPGVKEVDGAQLNLRTHLKQSGRAKARRKPQAA